MSGWRLPEGGAIDRSRRLSFTFDGRPLTGHPGDTIASALLANGVRIVARSFKYHRPRGLFAAGVEEPNALVDVTRDGRTAPNLRATCEPLVEGLAVAAVNAAPDAGGDRQAWIDRFSRFLPAGFYYKTFMWPGWELFEPRIRAMAGLGRLDPDHRPPGTAPQIDAACDLLVVGAGPAGLAAARAAAARGERVLLLDDQPEPGGSLRWLGGTIGGADWHDWVQDTLERVAAAGGRYLAWTTAYGIYDHGLVCAWRRLGEAPDQLWRIRPQVSVLAAGAIERPLTFPDNDRPGVMLAEAALRYLRVWAVAPGRRAVVATNNDTAYRTAAALAEAGVAVEILDIRSDSPAMATCDLPVHRGRLPEGVVGRGGVTAVRAGGRELAADALLVSGGWTPSVHLWRHAGGRVRFAEELAAFVPDGAVNGLRVAGAANGRFGLAAALADGHTAAAGAGPAPQPELPDPAYAFEPAWPRPDAEGRQWIDLQNDVTLKDVALAAREGFRSVEHLKRYTTLGMATDQGKTSNMAGLAAMAELSGRSIPEVGTTTFRPPFVPVPLSILGGRRRGQFFNPLRRLQLEPEHRAADAAFREYGGWLRPAWYARSDDPGAGPTAVAAEARAARQAVGLFDGSPLGKIEVIGPDAAKLLDFVLYNRVSTLEVGRIRYVLMLSESGVVFDDGVVARLAEDRFVFSCSSGHVPAVRLRLEEWRQDRFDPARVFVHDATSHWATLTATGPRARALVEVALPQAAPALAELAHMTLAESAWEDVPLRIARVSFTGDRSYELSVPQSAAGRLWARLCAGLEGHGGRRIGLEALLTLRAEKGFVVVGKDTDGLTLPQDLGMEGPLRKRNDEFVGRRSLMLPDAQRDDRRQLVGLQVPDGAPPLPTGAHAVTGQGPQRRSIGYVTSSYDSPALGRPIALGLIERGRARLGERVRLLHLGAGLEATLCAPAFFDPQGARIDA